MRRFLIALAGLALICAPLGACQKSAEKTNEENAKASAAFMEKNAKEPGIQVLPSGVQYKVIKSGPEGGLHPRFGDEVKVNYQGTLIDGTEFDSSYERGLPSVFQVGAVIPGFDEALKLMEPGDEWMVYIPADKAYGDEEKGGGKIPANSALIFKVELVDVLQHYMIEPKQG